MEKGLRETVASSEAQRKVRDTLSESEELSSDQDSETLELVVLVILD